MKYLSFLVLLVVLSACATKSSKQEVENKIKKRLAEVKGDFAVVFQPLDGKAEALSINAKMPFHAASTMKVPVMVEVYRQAAEGKFSLSDSILVKNEFKSIVDGSAFSLNVTDDGEEKLYQMLGKKQTVYDLTYDMIIWSSNLATNLIVELVDAQQVTQTMQKMGAPTMKVLRGVEDQKAFDQGLNNSTTAKDLAVILEKIALKKAVSESASSEMLKILLGQKFKDIIPPLLPADLKIAHKTGSITGVRHDAAIVELPDGRRYILVLLSKNMPDAEAGIKAMSEVSKMVYEYFDQN